MRPRSSPRSVPRSPWPSCRSIWAWGRETSSCTRGPPTPPTTSALASWVPPRSPWTPTPTPPPGTSTTTRAWPSSGSTAPETPTGTSWTPSSWPGSSPGPGDAARSSSPTSATPSLPGSLRGTSSRSRVSWTPGSGERLAGPVCSPCTPCPSSPTSPATGRPSSPGTPIWSARSPRCASTPGCSYRRRSRPPSWLPSGTRRTWRFRRRSTESAVRYSSRRPPPPGSSTTRPPWPACTCGSGGPSR